YFEDEDGTREIEDLAAWKVGAGQLPLAPHTLTLVEGQSPTCVEDGWKDYYHCEVCDEYFEDEDGASRIEDLDAWKVNAGKVEATGHELTKIDGKVATCTEPGWKDYYQCSVCQHYFEDEDGTTPIANLDAWKVGAGKVVVPHTEVVTYEWNGRICTATKSCGVCHQVLDTESIVGTYVKDWDATCVANEKGHYTATFTRLSTETKVTLMFDVEGTALGHEYEITYTWNKDKTECVAKAHCVRDPEHSDSDIQETASISAGTIKIEGFYFVARFESEEFEEQRIPLLNNVEIIAVAACGTVILICLIVGIAAGIKSSRKPQAQLNRKAKAEARKEAKAEKKAKAEAKKQAQEQNNEVAKAKSEEKVNADAERKAKADAERKAKAEADKKAKAEANKQANTDKEAKAEAKRQALEQKKADAEAKKQAKLEAKERKKAEAEAKKQAKDKKNVGQPEEDASVKAEVNKLMKERLQSEIRVERLKQISESLKKAKTENPEAAKERISLAKEKLAELKSNKLTKKK
ncbi:MAG: hypothetical protein MJ152_01955, partial [Clostridia bacterium]|nr:hypothetical protein [Clostridia bacterium]